MSDRRGATPNGRPHSSELDGGATGSGALSSMTQQLDVSHLREAKFKEMADKAEVKKKAKKPKRERPVIVAPASPGAVTPLTGVPSAQGARTVPKRPPSRTAAQRRLEDKKVRPVLKLLNGLLTLIVVVLLGAGGTAYYLHAAVDADGPLGKARLLSIPRNDGVQQIAERLETEGMVGDRRMFLAGLYTMRAASLMPGGRVYNLKAGQYEIKPGASIRSIVETLSEGRSVLTKVTIPEGLTSYQIVERLKADMSLTGDVREVPPEGSLLPETYSLPAGSPRQTVIDMMQAAQKKLVDQLWAERQDGLPYKTPAEAMTMASIVERETGRNDERDRVAAVFVNRLRFRMPLQSDPTILYGQSLGKVQWGRTIFQSDIKTKTAYNTYTIPALPPSPICNPGRATLEASLKPAATKDLYFVANGHGGHVFAASLAEHNANVAKWRQIERDRVAPQPAGAAPAAAAQAPVPITNTLNAAPTAKAVKQ